MKALIVTSALTYVPDNHQPFFKELFVRSRRHLAGLMLLGGHSINLVGSLGGIYWLGARGIAKTLARNIAELPLKKRERLFERNCLPVLRAKSMNEDWVAEWIEAQDIDLVVNVRTRCIYRSRILNAPRLGCVNIHHGILPRHRGVLCDLYALAEGRPAGFTIHVMEPKIDTGKILVRHQVSSGAERNYLSYLSRTGPEEAGALATVFDRVDQEATLPEGIPNICRRPIYTRTPDGKKVRTLRKLGIEL